MPKSRLDSIDERTFWSTWGRVAALSFGGPAGQIAVMRRIIVDEKKWIDEERFQHALSFCMLLPGPEAQQLAVYLGWLLKGIRGGLISGSLFILPGAVAILALSFLYENYRDVALMTGLFFGLKSAVAAIVVAALIRIAKPMLGDRLKLAVAVASFIAMYALELPFPVIIASAFVLGWMLFTDRRTGDSPESNSTRSNLLDAGESNAESITRSAPLLRSSIVVIAVAAASWFLPIVALRGWFGPDSIFVAEAFFFSKAAVVTFGGAYAVLAYLSQQAVDRLGWIDAPTMIDGLGMAETTPGPLIMVCQFVGYAAAFRRSGSLDPNVAGLFGSIVTTWTTFVPSFFWVFFGAPFVERLRRNKSVAGGLAGVKAAVVGVIAYVSVLFTMHVLFRNLVDKSIGPWSIKTPVAASFDPVAGVIVVSAFVMMFGFRLGMFKTSAISSALGLCLKAVV